MIIKIFIIVIIPFLLLFTACIEEPIDKSGKIITVGTEPLSSFQRIQDAINTSSEGDTILIFKGEYQEIISVKKSLMIKAENNNQVIISYKGAEHQKDIITISADSCSIKGLIIKNSGNGTNIQGIKINSDNNHISNNTFLFMRQGAILSEECRGNHIDNNTFKDNYNGIWFSNAHENEMFNNSFYNNLGNGIQGKKSRGNLIYHNSFVNNSNGIYFCCSSVDNVIFENSFILNNDSHVKGSNNNVWHFNGKGNYWDDYGGIDMNEDFIGDSPYEIEGGIELDQYPLMNPIN